MRPANAKPSAPSLPQAGRVFRAGSHCWEFPRKALIMGVLNVTPDSFSDGGKFAEPQAAIAQGMRMAAEGAEIIDVGGESTRPGAAEVSVEEELRRVLPVIEGLAAARAPISIDTKKPSVARAALRAGASIINDIAANRSDAEMWEIAAETGAGYVLMHMRGTPQTMQAEPRYADVVAEVGNFFAERMALAQRHGLSAEQIALDPGIGFGKTLEHNLQLLGGLRRFTMGNRPVLVGASRKSFIGKLLGAPVEERLPGSLACAVWGALRGAGIIRAHDVAATVQAVRMAEEIQARSIE